jgi:hypothetical protein
MQPWHCGSKLWGEPSLVFIGVWFGIYAIVPQLTTQKYKIMSWKKKEFEYLKVCSFLLNFIL